MSCLRSGAGYALLFAGMTIAGWKPIVQALSTCGAGRASLSGAILLLLGATVLCARLVRSRL